MDVVDFNRVYGVDMTTLPQHMQDDFATWTKGKGREKVGFTKPQTNIPTHVLGSAYTYDKERISQIFSTRPNEHTAIERALIGYIVQLYYSSRIKLN